MWLLEVDRKDANCVLAHLRYKDRKWLAMGWTPLPSPLLLLLHLSSTLVVVVVVAVEGPSLACERIPPSFCCTSRVRLQCGQRCANVDCGPNFIQSLLSIDSPVEAKDGNTRIGSFQPEVGSVSVDSRPPPVAQPEFSRNFGEAERPQPPPPPPPPPPPASFMPPRELILPGTSSPVQPSPGGQERGFPTLIPTGTDSSLVVTNSPNPDQPTRSAKRRTTPDPRIIRPPDSLVIIGDYDEDAAENSVDVGQPQPQLPQPPVLPQPAAAPLPAPVPQPQPELRAREEISFGPGIHSGIANVPSSARLVCRVLPPGRLVCERALSVASRSATRPTTRPASRSTKARIGGPAKPLRPPSIRRRKNFKTTRILMPLMRRESRRRRLRLAKFTRSASSPEWKVALIPRGSHSTSVRSVPPFTVDGKADARLQKFYRAIDAVIANLSFKNSPNIHLRKSETDTAEQVVREVEVVSPQSTSSSRTTVAPKTVGRVSVLPFRPLGETDFRFSTPSPPALPPSAMPPPVPSAPIAPQCGVAPAFIPCVSNEIASRALLACCRQRNLPAGCLPLCRYDVTQAEIRSAMDRGQCGIFSVAPFLECASQGRDNSECCRHRGVVQRTGPQCEQFCRPTSGLSALGLQHIVCGNAVGDMLHCHHSGVRP